jgi:hypothetical protein
MRHKLPPGLSFCRLDREVLMLDVRRDRYFCLGGALANTLCRLADGAELEPAQAEAARALVAGGLLSETEGRAVAGTSIAVPSESFLDRPLESPSLGARIEACRRIEHARLALNVRGLYRTLARIERRKARILPHAAALADMSRLVAAFTAPGWFRAAEGECLRRSIGLADALASRGIAATLVIAVKLRPFAAHCWVQTDTVLINERHDRVRDFTPILVL